MNLHFGSGQPRYGLPTLLRLSSMFTLPHFRHRCFVGRAVTTGLPSASRFISVGQSGAPWQVKNVPKRPSLRTMNLPHAGQAMSVTVGSGRSASPSAGLM